MFTLFPVTAPQAGAVLIRLVREALPWRKLEMELKVADVFQRAVKESE